MYLASFKGCPNQRTTFQPQSHLLEQRIKLLPFNYLYNSKQQIIKRRELNSQIAPLNMVFNVAWDSPTPKTLHISVETFL